LFWMSLSSKHIIKLKIEIRCLDMKNMFFLYNSYGVYYNNNK
jgi:hypothetical protein